MIFKSSCRVEQRNLRKKCSLTAIDLKQSQRHTILTSGLNKILGRIVPDILFFLLKSSFKIRKFAYMIRQNIKVAVDAVVFGYKDRTLNVLLIKRNIEPFKDSWALPGGLVLENESLEDAVERELKEETNVTIDYLEQLYSFGKPGRDPRNRVVSVTYFALVKPEHHTIKADTDAKDVAWFDLQELPELAFDHQHIVDVAKERLQNKLTYEPIGFDLLADKFLFSDLEKLYMTILEKQIDRRNFRKKILSFDILEELDEKISEGRGRPANLFKINQTQYFKLKKEGFLFDIK